MAVTAAIIDSAEREDGHRELLEEDVDQVVVPGTSACIWMKTCL